MNDFEKLINERLYLFDFEVTKFDWLLVIHKYSDNSETVFHNANADDVYDFINKCNPILLGHNARYYDQYILKAILAGFSINEIKSVNDHLVKGGQGFEIDYGYVENFPPIWDTLQDIVPPKSLKEIEACLLLDITESTIDFDIDHAWSKEEYNEMLYYCRHDVDALRPLFEARKTYFETKYDICVLVGIEPDFNIGLTNAKLCAKFLEAEKIDRDDEREYEIPNTICVEKIDKRILDFFDRIHDESISSEELFTSKLEIDFHGMPSVFGWGGAHGAIPNFKYETTENEDSVIINADFASLYPHLLALPVYNFISRNIRDKNKYKDTLDTRLELKHLGKKKEQLGLKLILNTTYGCQNNKYNDLYDPKGARGTCISGQLLISELTETIYSLGDVELIQLNTDGIMIKIKKERLNDYYKVCDDFSKKCQIELEYDVINKIIQRDVNNYILTYGDDTHKKIKAKGGCFASLPELTINEDGSVTSKYKPNFKANSLAIVSEALARNLLFDTPIEETINNCTNVHMFQLVQHLGSTYEKCIQESPNGDIKLQRNNRIYASKKPSGKIVKVKYDGRRDSLANCPENPIVDNANKCTIEDINKQWYIKLAKQWANDFKGIKRVEDYKKTELFEMAKNMGIEFDPKIKKGDLIRLIEENKEERNDDNTSTNLPYKVIDRSGQKLGNIYFKSFAYTKNKKSYWNCVCQCGNSFVQRYDTILKSHFKCCKECYNNIYKHKRTQHISSDGDTKTNSSYHRLYNIWVNMRRRCRSPLSGSYYRYGARGIDVCEEWFNSYISFKEWSLSNGYRNDLTLDRIDNDDDYKPSNCRWATDYEQARNKRTNHMLEYNGRNYCITDLARFLNIPHASFYTYLKKANNNVDEAVILYRNSKDRKKD